MCQTTSNDGLELYQFVKGEQQMRDSCEGKPQAVTAAIPEVGFVKEDDCLPTPNRFQDVREVTNLVRYAKYMVDNMAAVITEDIAEGQAAAAMLKHTTGGLMASVEALKGLTGGR